jgi:hypothetical protein
MTKINGFKRIVSDLEFSLNLIEEEISSIPDGVVADTRELVGEVSKAVVNLISAWLPVSENPETPQNSKSESRENKIKRLSEDLEKMKSKVESARQTYAIPYKHTKLNDSGKNVKEVEAIIMGLLSLSNRIKKAQDKIQKKSLFSDQDNIQERKQSKTIKENNSWEEITSLHFDDK